MTTTLNGHIEVDDKGNARMAGSRLRVIDLVMTKTCNGFTPEEVQQSFPQLSLAAVYAALSYYHDHRAECDAQIEEEDRFAEEMRASTPEGPFIARMRSLGKL